MEIGGFITEGAEIVNHDNSLSGNGTLTSPLGVVPGYNETVLWSGNATIGSEMTLSEPFQNFKDIRIKNGHNAYWTKPAWTLTGNQDALFEFGYAGNILSTAANFSYEHYAILYSGHDNTLKATSSIVFTITTAGNVTRTVNSNNYSTRTFEIVGINRINNA